MKDFSDPQMLVAINLGAVDYLIREGGLNHLYNYVQGNPLSFTDPSGLLTRTASNIASGVTATAAASSGSIPIDPTRPRIPGYIDPTSSGTLQCASSGKQPPFEPEEQCKETRRLQYNMCKAVAGNRFGKSYCYIIYVAEYLACGFSGGNFPGGPPGFYSGY